MNDSQTTARGALLGIAAAALALLLIVSACRAAAPRTASEFAATAEEACTAYITAALRDDAARMGALTEKGGFDLGTPQEVREDYFHFEHTVEVPLAFELVDRFDAGEEPGHEGLRYRVTEVQSGRLVGELTVYVGIEDGRYFVWALST
jgi:hypothetical protein